MKPAKAFFSALKGHDNARARELLDQHPDLVDAVAGSTPKRDAGQSPLQVAFKSGNSAMAKATCLMATSRDTLT